MSRDILPPIFYLLCIGLIAIAGSFVIKYANQHGIGWMLLALCGVWAVAMLPVIPLIRWFRPE